MRFTFRLEDRIRKLCYIEEVLHPGSTLLSFANAAPLLSKNFQDAMAVRDYLYDKSREEMWTVLLEGSAVEAKLNKLGKSGLLKAIDELGIPLKPKDDILFKQIESDIISEFDRVGERSKEWMKKIFDFELPDELTIVLTESYSKYSMGGSGLTYKPPAIGICVTDYRAGGFYKGYMDLILHEILHVLISKNNSMKHGLYEEALLDYFAPRGIFAEKIGMIEGLDLDKHQKTAVDVRPLSKAESDTLLPAIKAYYKVCGETTIWEFLKNNKFGFVLEMGSAWYN